MRKLIQSTNSPQEIQRTLRWLWLTIGVVVVGFLIVALVARP